MRFQRPLLSTTKGDSTVQVAAETERAPRVAGAQFRPDIQALRAVAVSAVVLYHLWPDAVPGGFIGVDIFFVISGFLITGHLLREVERTGRIAVADFWARRIRRLLPAAFTVLIASVIALFLVMPSLTWQDTLQEIAASAAYVENWLLARHAVDYLAAENTATLAQHYWSLSVEEQFYIVWPLVLMAALAGSRLMKRADPRIAVIGTLGLIFLVSLAFSLYLTAVQPSLAFFATHTRAWEFAAGGLVASIAGTRGRSRFRSGRVVAAVAGPPIILASILAISGAVPFPGWIALIPVLGTVCCLVGGEHARRWPAARVVEHPAIQWLGDRSYSIYLWHWPLIIIAPWMLNDSLNSPVKWGLLALTLVLADVTKRYVEDPIRIGTFWRSRRWPSYALAAAGMVALVGVSSVGFLQVEQSNASAEAVSLRSIMAGEPCFGAPAMESSGACEEPYARPSDLDTAFGAADVFAPAARCQPGTETTTPVVCTFGEKESPTRIIAVVGNSHALRLMPALDLYGKEHGWKIVLMARTDCMGLTTSPIGSQLPGDTCSAWSGNVQKDLLAMDELDAVVFASHVAAELYLAGEAPTALDIEDARTQIAESWTRFAARGVPVIVTEDVPGMRPESGPECIARSAGEYDPCAIRRSDVLKANLMTELAQERPDLVTYVPLAQYFCDASECHALIGGVIVYSDSHHLTTTYSRTLAQYIGTSIDRTISG